MEQTVCSTFIKFWECNDASIFWSALTAIGTIGATIISLACLVIIPAVRNFITWKQNRTKFSLSFAEFREPGDDKIKEPHISMVIKSRYDIRLELNSAKLILKFKNGGLPLVFDLKPVKKTFLLPMEETGCDLRIVDLKSNKPAIKTNKDLANYVNKGRIGLNRIYWCDKLSKVDVIVNAENGRFSIPLKYWAISEVVDGIQGALYEQEFPFEEPSLENIKDQLREQIKQIGINTSKKKKQVRKERRQMKFEEKLHFLHLNKVKLLLFRIKQQFQKTGRSKK